MTAVEVGLVVVVALLALTTVVLGRTVVAHGRRVTLLERQLRRAERRELHRQPELATSTPSGGPAPSPSTEADLPPGDAVDLRGTDAEGEPVTVPLERHPEATALVFLSTSCGICLAIWDRLRSDGLGPAAHVRPVVVTKDIDQEDVAKIRELQTPDLTLALSSEAWEDYEVPGSPYAVVVSAEPGSVIGEGAPTRWEDLVHLVASATTGAGSGDV